MGRGGGGGGGGGGEGGGKRSSSLGKHLGGTLEPVFVLAV